MGINKRPASASESDEPMMEISVIGDGKDAMEEDSSPCAKKLKTSGSKKKRKSMLSIADVSSILPKNPVSLLNELRQGLVYDLVSQTGPVHAPVFTMHVLVDGITFTGTGRSKKLAKVSVAKNALQSLLDKKLQHSVFYEPTMAPITYNQGLVNVDFTSDDPADANFIINEMNRIQTGSSGAAADAFQAIQIPAAAGPLSTLPPNAAAGAAMGPPGGAALQIKKSMGEEEETEGEDCYRKEQEEAEDSEKEESVDIKVKELLLVENQNDSGLVEDEENSKGSDSDLSPAVVKAKQEDEEESDDENKENQSILQEVELTAAIIEEIRLSMTYDEFKADEQKVIRSQKLAVPDKGPVMLLYELFTDIQFECVQTTAGTQFSRFKMCVKVQDETFEGTGPSKRLAKTAAAKAALAQLCNISYSPMQSKHLSISESSSMEAETNNCAELPQILADGIGKLVQDKYAELMVGYEQYVKRKVLAGIVMTENGQLENAKVISVSTGTKCINGEHISIIGAVVNDCHAEIISRRCLMIFLYSQLRLLFSEETKSTSIFEACPERPELYQLKAGIEFHLYINTAPCGDARIFSPHDGENNNIDKHPNRKARGQLRTKIESGEGTIPVKNGNSLQTWDGIIQGQRLLTMSCSDKIAKWNVMGIQGSLLTSLIRPIYLSSIVLGSLLHPAHMYRAVCGRIEAGVGNLPSPYYLNRPKLALVTSAEQRNQMKAPNYSVNWSYGDAEVEIINSVTGKTIQSQVSRISKQNFIVRYMNAAQHLKATPPPMDSDYGELKAAVTEYQEVKDQLYKAFVKEDLGNWLKKPVEQDQFTLQN